MKLYIITVIYSKDEVNINGIRTVGIYTSLEKAKNVVVNNHLDIWEHCYNYACIEVVNSNELYPIPEKQIFYKYRKENMKYIQCNEDMFTNIGPISLVG